MTLSMRLKTGIGAIALCCTTIVATSCSLSPNDLPSMRGGVDGGYNVVLQFSSVMSLPSGADVMMDGLRVGEVGKVDVSGQAVTVTVHLRTGTRVPTDVRAVIRQNTILGDTYIALDRDAADSGGGYLQPGATVPVSRTTAPPQLEDTMAVLAYFINGGSIQKMEDSIGGINAVMPAVTAVRRLSSTAVVDMRDLGHDTAEIDRTLAGLNATAVAFDDKSSTLSTMFTPSAMHYWRRAAVNLIAYVSQVLPAIGSIFEGGLWLVPMLGSLANSVGDMRATWDEAPSDAEKLSTFLRTTIVPFAHAPSVNILSVDSAQGDKLIGDVENVLRMLGAVK